MQYSTNSIMSMKIFSKTYTLSQVAPKQSNNMHLALDKE
jgi:hypothetical protein